MTAFIIRAISDALAYKKRLVAYCWMRIAIFLFLMLFVAGFLPAQVSFQKKISIFLDSALIRCTPDGEYVYLASTVVQNSQSRLHLLKMDNSGNVIWHLQHISTNTTLRLYDALSVSDGLVVSISSGQGESASDGFLQKFDINGNPVWGKRIGTPTRTRIFELEKDGQENIFLSGVTLPDQAQTPGSAFYFLMYLSPNGSIINGTKSEHSYFPGTEGELYQLTNLRWNPTDASLTMIEDFRGVYASSYISGLNRGTWSLGYTHDGLDYSEKIWGVQFSSIQSTSERIVFSGVTIFIGDYPVIGLFDADGKELKALKKTPYVLQPVHSYNGDILFYDPKNKSLTLYDTLLTPVWSKKFDNCIETTAFSAEADQNGAIFTVRTLKGRTLVSKILPGGFLSACQDYSVDAIPAQPLMDEGVGDNNAMGGVPCPLLAADSALVFTPQQTQTSDFCVKLDASFLLPDSVCFGADIPLEDIDTSADLSHAWEYGSEYTTIAQPEIIFPETGVFRVKHTVTNPICTDTASVLIHVIPAPVLQLEDTIICGPATFSLDLTQPAATEYWLDENPVAPMLSLSQSGAYHIRIANAECSDEKTIQVKIVEFPWPVADPDSILCGGVVYPAALTPGFENIFWDGQPGPDTFLIRDGAPHTYTATYSADPDCVIHGTVQVPRKACDSELLYVPNSFSPNDDGTNDFFEISPTADVEVLQYSVYDRWGACLFQTDNVQEHWDGKFKKRQLSPGVYVYWVRYRNKLTDEIEVKSGDVTLFR